MIVPVRRAIGSPLGVFQSAGGQNRRPAGTRTFFNTNGWSNAQLDDTGTTLLAGVGDYLYLLRDEVAAPPDFPDIEHVFFRFNDDCTLSLWASTRDLPAGAQLLLDVYIEGVPPTVAVDGAVNPFFSVRIPPELASEDGGGVSDSPRRQPSRRASGWCSVCWTVSSSVRGENGLLKNMIGPSISS